MLEVTLTPKVCPDKEALHAYLAEKLSFPEWYGGNLDALHDCLGDLKEEVSILVPDVEGLETSLGAYARRLMRVLVDASAENRCIHLSAE